MTQKPSFSNWFVKFDYLPKLEKQQNTDVFQSGERPFQIDILLADIQSLIETRDLQTWLITIVDFLNQYDVVNEALSNLLYNWPYNSTIFS